MSRCIIHIGMHKTGSTSIQGSLRGFSDGRFLYATLGSGHSQNHSVPMCTVFSSQPGRLSQHRSRDAAALSDYASGIRSDLERAIESAKGRTLIISGEGISSRLKRAEVFGMREYFAKRFDTVTIVGYVRPPAAYMASAFQQRLKVGAAIDLRSMYRSYESRFRKFDESFGRENVHLWKFDPTVFPGGCVVRDFCARLDISLPADRIVRLNESLSREAIGLLFIYRSLRSKQPLAEKESGQERRLLKPLKGIGKSRFRFSPELIWPVLTENRADIEWMEARLGQSLHEELGEHQPGDVRDESDLPKSDPDSVEQLLAALGGRAPAGVTGATQEEVAKLVHALAGEASKQAACS